MNHGLVPSRGRPSATLLAFTGLSLLLAACSDDEPGSPPTPGGSGNGAVVSETAATPPGPRLVYSTSASPSWPSRTIIAYYPRTSSRVVLLEYGGPNDKPVAEQAGVGYVYFATENRVVRSGANGGGELELFSVTEPSKTWIGDIGLSPDGSTLALSLLGELPSDNLLLLLEAVNGAELGRWSRNDPEFADFAGFLWRLLWRDNGAGLLVKGPAFPATAREG